MHDTEGAIGPWDRLGHALRAERGSIPLAKIAKASGVSARMIQEYEGGKIHDEPPGKLWDLVNFYGWTPDSMPRILARAGEQPTYRAGPRPIPALAARVEERLRAAVDGLTDMPVNERRRLVEQLTEGTSPPTEETNTR